LFCGSPALADDFSLGTAGPGNWGILETSNGATVSLNNNTGITVNSGASASQANLGINNASKLNQSGTVVVQGTYYKFSTNADSTTSGFTAVGGVNTTSTGKITTAATQASAASSNLAALTPNQSLGTLTSSTTITANVSGRNVIALTGINMNGNILTLSGSASQSFVINVSGSVTFGAVNLIGGLTAANVIFNVTGGNAVNDNSPDTINGIIMDINGTVSLNNNDTVNGEIISGNNITLNNNSDVEVVPTVPEASTAVYFTLGPLSLVAGMLLYRRFSHRKKNGCRQFSRSAGERPRGCGIGLMSVTGAGRDRGCQKTKSESRNCEPRTPNSEPILICCPSPAEPEPALYPDSLLQG
jgi:hypothetical protein